MPLLKTAGAQVFYETWAAGDGAAWVALVNGHTRTHADFASLAATLNRKGYSVLALDNRGCGKTVTERAFSLDEMAQDVEKLIQQQAGGLAHLVGFSLGGAVSLKLAAQHPKSVRSLCLVSSTTTWEDSLPDAMAPDFIAQLDRFFSVAFFKAQQNFIIHFAKDLRKRAEEPQTRQGAIWQRKALEAQELTPLLQRIHLPTLVIHGDEDRVIAIARAITMHQNIAASRLEILSGVGHLPLVECPARLYDKIADFIKQVDNTP